MKTSEYVAPYIDQRRLDGLLYDKAKWTLTAFCKRIGDVPITLITSQHVLAFLNDGETSINTWRAKHSVVKRFFEFCTARGARSALIMSPLPAAARRPFLPYIYKRGEIRALLKVLPSNQESDATKIGADAYRTLLLTLYGTGAMLGEALSLRIRDVDLGKGFVAFQGNRIIQSRRIPVSPDVKSLLAVYLQSKTRRNETSSNVFLSKSGNVLTARNVADTFRRLRNLAGVIRNDGAHCGPGMRDFRPTFAVHRITSWIRAKADLNQMIPALSVYLGHGNLATTEQYLSLTPDRFRSHLMKLSPGHSNRRWRDDPELMKFLSEL